MSASLTVARIFSDGMVLQRDMPVPLWGTAEPGTDVEVSFGDQSSHVGADRDGRWMVTLEPLNASSEGRELHIRSSHDPAAARMISNVVVGDVWLCGGQSNMEYTMEVNPRDTAQAPYEPAELQRQQEIREALDAGMRHFKVDVVMSPFDESTEIPSRQGWMEVGPGTTKDFTAVGYYFGRELRRELGVPVGLISCNRGATMVEPWVPAEGYAEVPDAQAYLEQRTTGLRKDLEAWHSKGEEAVSPADNPCERADMPTTLFNGMIAPLIPYALKGVIWYQGESNRDRRHETFRDTTAAMIRAWRSRWGQEQLYFFCCQLAYFKDPVELPQEQDPWMMAEVRDEQRRLLHQVEDAGMAVLHDTGHRTNIHPPNKQDAGHRLARWALHACYGQDVIPSGPLYREAHKQGSRVRVSFDYAGSGLMAGMKEDLLPVRECAEPLSHFQICDRARAWRWAEARIVGPDTIEVWHPAIDDPQELRYAWAAYPKGANLYNREGLPASPFKTEPFESNEMTE